METALVIERTVDRPLHIRTIDELVNAWVSSLSRWHDPRWKLDNQTHGARQASSMIVWDFDLVDGTNFLDDINADLLDWVRRFLWSLFVAPGDHGPALKPGTAGSLSTAMRRWVRWMAQNHIRRPSQLDSTALDQFLEELPSLLVVDDEAVADNGDVLIGVSAVENTLRIVYHCWHQRKALLAAGIESMPGRPWPNAPNASALAKSIATKAEGWLQPLPDEVAIPLLTRAVEMIGLPASDVIRLLQELEGEYHRPPGHHPRGTGESIPARLARVNKAGRRFVFSTLPGAAKPWHASLSVSGKSVGLETKQLIKALEAAGCIVLQALTGMRVSELCGLTAGIDGDTGLPNCVEVKASATRLNEVFVLRADLSKTQSTPLQVPWLLGMRPMGSTELPTAVTAIIMLSKLMQPYRELLGTDKLLVSFHSRVGLPRSEDGVSRMTGHGVMQYYRDFMAEWVDLSPLPDESAHRTSPNDLVKWRSSKGGVITTHQLRKTFALYVLQTDPTLLPAVKRQYQHISMAMTEGGYWGKNTPQIEPLESVSAQQTTLMIYEAVSGRSRIAGRMGKALEIDLAPLRSKLKGMGIEQGWRETVRWVADNRVEATHGLHGACVPVHSGTMWCHKIANSRPLGHRRPNYMTREPSLCAGCDCLVLDHRHISFWQDRYVTNKIEWLRAQRRGDGDSFWVVRDRAEQARKFLRSLGVDEEQYERRIQEAFGDAGTQD